MCGIAGIVSFGNPLGDTTLLKKMTNILAHRGPDGEGQWLSPCSSAGLGHRRLSIIDTSVNANQPMHYLNRYTITLNGEIYNYKELKSDLLQQGYQFQSESDTEVLLALFDQKKELCLADLDGMFAFAIWDNIDKRLFCARDRFGEKPFYYHVTKDAIYFASEMKALFAIGINAEVDKFMVSNFLFTDLVVNPQNEEQTFFRGIKKLPKSHYFFADTKGKIEQKKYYSIATNPSNLSLSEAESKLKDLLAHSVKIRLRSDVPVASTLSGGIDSAIIEYLIRSEQNNSLQKNVTFSARFNEQGFSENEFLDELLIDKKNQNFSIYPGPELIHQTLEKIFYHQEEPFWSASMLNHWAVMENISHYNYPVILEGQGADELFGGYTWHSKIFLQELFTRSKKLYAEELKFQPKSNAAGLTGKFKAFSPGVFKATHKALYLLKQKSPLASLFGLKWKKIIDKSFINMTKTGKTYLPPNNSSLTDSLLDDFNRYYLESLVRIGDRNSMAFSKELRMPFLNHKLVEFAFSLPSEYKIRNGWQKYILRSTFEDNIPSKIAWRKDKIGFAAPQDKWMRDEENMRYLKDAIKLLVENKWIKQDSVIPAELNWKLVMLYSLLKFSKTDFTTC